MLCYYSLYAIWKRKNKKCTQSQPFNEKKKLKTLKNKNKNKKDKKRKMEAKQSENRRLTIALTLNAQIAFRTE